MTFIDLILIAVVAGSVIGGFTGGFARVSVGFIASVAGIISAFWFYGVMGSHVQPYVNSRPVANLLGFFLILILFSIAGALIGRILAKMFRWIGLSWLDRLAGGAFGIARGALLCVALVTVILACAPTPPPAAIVNSRFIPYLIGPSHVMAAMIPRELRDAFDDTTNKVRRMWSEHANQQPEKHAGGTV